MLMHIRIYRGSGHGPTCRTIRVYEQRLRYKSGLSMMMMCWNCEMMEKISIQFMRLDYFSNMCACTRLTRLQLYKTKYVLRIAVTRSNPVPDIILSLPKWDEDQDMISISGVSTGEK